MMPSVTHNCEFEGCDWTVDTDTISDYVQLLKIHVQARHPQQTGTSKAEKARRPELNVDVSDEDWSYFKSRWDQYKKATSLTGEDLVTQLLECCSESLRRDHHRTFSGANAAADITEETVLAELKTIAVCKRNRAVNRVKLGLLKQDRGEPVRKFAGRIRSLATVSEYSIKCTKADCTQLVNYTEPVIMDQLTRGLADPEIQKDVLSHTDSDTMDLETLIKYVEGKESGLASQGLMGGGALNPALGTGQGRGQQQGKRCRWCGESHPQGKEHCKAAGQTCSACGKVGHFSKVCRSSNTSSKKSSGQSKAQDNSSNNAAITDSTDNCALFIDNKNIIYPSVLIGKEASKNISLKIKKLPAQDCNLKEVKTELKSHESGKKLLTQDCKDKDGDKIKLKEWTDPCI